MKHIVYQTTNLINGKIYVGVSNGKNKNYLGSGQFLKKAIEKYGWDSFERETLFECDDGDEAYWLERIIINKEFIKFHDCYNAQIGGYSGYFHTKETCKKISESKIGIPRPPHVREIMKLNNLKRSEEAKERNKNKPKKKKEPINPEITRKKISESVKKLWQNPEYRAHMEKVNIGRKPPPKTPEGIESLRQHNLGKHSSKETRRKIGLNNPHRKPIIMIVNNEPLLLFESIAEASRITGYKENAIRHVVKGRAKTNGKWFGNKFVKVKWEYEKRT